MQQSRLKLTTQAALMASIAAAFPVVAQGAPAARVDFAIGNVAAVNKAGQSRPVAKGAVIEEGETISTNNGRTQLRFTDGAYVSLQPQSEFRIDQYRYDGKQDGSEKTFLSLLKGGLRTITGFVGRTNKKNYQVATTVATIGIRGTEYTIQYGGSISGTVGEGEIEVCNGAGCLNVTNGESYYVANQDAKPQLSNKGTDLPPAPPETPLAYFLDGESIDAGGLPVGFALVGKQTLDFLQGIVGGVATPILGSAMEFDENGTLLSVGGLSVTSVQMNGNDGIMAWGTHQDLSRTGVSLVHFVAGLPADLTALSGTTGTYSLIGSTPVTDVLNAAVGSLNDAKLSVNFLGGASNSATADMFWTINGAPLSAKLSASFGSNIFNMSGSCGVNCNVNANLALFGPNAPRAGMVYDIAGSFVGAAAYGKQ